MATTSGRQYPPGTGWLVGYVLALIFGALAWVIAREVTIALIVFVATGPALGVAFEESLSTRPLSGRQRRMVFALAALGTLVGLVVLVALVFV